MAEDDKTRIQRGLTASGDTGAAKATDSGGDGAKGTGPEEDAANNADVANGIGSEDDTANTFEAGDEAAEIVEPGDTANSTEAVDDAAKTTGSDDDDATRITATPNGAIADVPASVFSTTPPPTATFGIAPDTGEQAGPLGVGSLLKQRFQILEVLGEGGMGVVFKAADVRKLEARSRNPYVAIKVLNSALSNNHTLIAGLQRECEKAQELSHPNIITVYDFDRDGSHVFMSMEYLQGKTLSQLIREARAGGGMTFDQAWPIIRAMGEALAHAHKKNIVHSDFKPANVFVTEHHDVKVLDFGIASRLGQAESDETIFDARAEGGLTPPYASFEMLIGSRADPRDDIYAFGLVVYEMLTGKHPYERRPASSVFLDQRNGLNVSPEPVADLSRKQWLLLKSAIEILQEKRPHRLDEWLAQFDAGRKSKWLYPSLIGLGGVVLVAVWLIASRQDKPVTATVEPAVREAPKPEIAAAPETAMARPTADAGRDLRGRVGETLVLDGGQSRAEDGGALSYAWRLASQPPGSASVLLNADASAPQLLPDQPGRYVAELTVTDAGQRASAPTTVAIEVDSPLPPADPHRATSADGVLSLAAAKAEYRIGEALELTLKPAKAGYLRVAYITSTGEVAELLPNKYQSSKVKADAAYRIPPKPGSFKLQITGPAGFDKIVAVYGETPIAGVKSIVNADGTLVPELQGLQASTATIRYQVTD